VFLLFHIKTIFQVIFYDQQTQRICLGLETEYKLFICYLYYKSCHHRCNVCKATSV